MFESPLFKAIPHQIELTTIKRQNADDRDFINCLKEIRYGNCEQKSLEFFTSLSRDLSEAIREGAVHIFFKRLPVQIFNLNILFSMPGVLYTFNAIDEGDVSGIKWIECQPTVPQQKPFTGQTDSYLSSKVF